MSKPAKAKAYQRPKHLAKYTHVSAFIGPMIYRDTKAPAMCDVCKTERATWVHEEKETGKQVGLCFGCGDH